MKSFLIVIFYLDYIYIVVYKTSIENKLELIKKGISDLLFENIVFTLIAISVINYQISIGQEIGIMVMASVFTSLGSTAYVVYNSYIMRIRYSKIYLDKSE